MSTLMWVKIFATLFHYQHFFHCLYSVSNRMCAKEYRVYSILKEILRLKFYLNKNRVDYLLNLEIIQYCRLLMNDYIFSNKYQK